MWLIEFEGLIEIDAYATRADANMFDEGKRLTLKLIRTGSMWAKSVGFWPGHADDQHCSLCNAAKDTPEQLIWHCKAFKEKRREADPELANSGLKFCRRPLSMGLHLRCAREQKGLFGTAKS